MKNFLLIKKALPLLLPALLIAAFAIPAKAAVTQLGASTSTTNSNTHSVTVGGGTNRILMVAISDADATDITSATFGATPMIQQIETTDGTAVDSIWTISLGTSVSSISDTITVTTNGGTATFIGAIAFAGVDQTVPTSNIDSNAGTTSPSASTLNIASAPGNLVFDLFDTFSIGANNLTPGVDQIVTHSETVDLGDGEIENYRTSINPGGATVSLGGGTVPMSWTTDSGLAFIHIALSINAAPTASAVTVGGRILTADGRGIRGALISITDINGVSRTVQTGTFGNYLFEGIEVGQTYTLQVFAKRYSFAQSTRLITVDEEITDADFVAEKR